MPQGIDGGVHRGLPRDHDRLRRCGDLARVRQQVEAAAVRQVEVEEEDVGWVLRELLASLPQVGGRRHVEALVAHVLRQRAQEAGVVVHDERVRFRVWHLYFFGRKGHATAGTR